MCLVQLGNRTAIGVEELTEATEGFEDCGIELMGADAHEARQEIGDQRLELEAFLERRSEVFGRGGHRADHMPAARGVGLSLVPEYE